MDRTTLARKLREALFDHIEAGRRDALQDGAVDALFEAVLALCGSLSLDVERLHSTQKAILKTWVAQQQDEVDLMPDLLTGTAIVRVDAHGSMTKVDPSDVYLGAPTCQCKPDTTSCGICWPTK